MIDPKTITKIGANWRFGGLVNKPKPLGLAFTNSFFIGCCSQFYIDF